MILLINYSHKWWYKALSVLLVIALILAISFGAAPRAHAVGVLTITVCAAILAVMAGAGIATVVSGMTSADIQNWMTGKLNEWDLYRDDGNVFSDLIQNNLITTTVKGALAIGNGAARGISDFITWLKNDLGLSNNSTTPILTGINLRQIFTFGDNNISYTISGNQVRITGTGNSNCNLYFNHNYNSLSFDLVVSDAISNFRLISSGTGTFSISNSSGLSLVSNNTVINATNTNPYGHIIFNKTNPSNGQFYASTDRNHTVYLYFNNININGNTLSDGTLSLDSDVINIPSVADDGQTDIVIGIDGVYPGATTDEAADVIMDGVLDNTLETTMTVTDEYVDAIEAVVINEQPISVNTDHHMIGFTNLPDFVNLNLNSIWHYVSDAVEYASGFISWFVNLLSSVPTLAIPLYMSFTLLIVLSFIRRILL